MPVFPFFVGSGRSGTTLLRAMFDSHPDLAVPPVAGFIVRLYPRAGRYTGDAFDARRLVDDLRELPRFSSWGIDDELLLHHLSNGSVRTFPDAMRAVFKAYAVSQDKSRYGDKTADHVMHMDVLGRLFPEARFVHIVRDGRDVALSYMEHKEDKWGSDRFLASIVRWKRRVERGRQVGASLGSRYSEIRYEDLVDEPEQVLRAACSFIDLDFSPAMLDYPQRAEKLTGSLSNPYAHRNIARAPTRTRDWRDQLGERDAGYFDAIAGEALDLFGYPRAPHVPRSVALKARKDLLAFRVRAGLHRTRRSLGARAGRGEPSS